MRRPRGRLYINLIYFSARHSGRSRALEAVGHVNIRTLCLGLLFRGEATGYEIRKQFEGPLGYIHEPSYGSIYPALTRLAREGLVSRTVQEQDKRPDKKIYRITPKGRAHFCAQLHEAVPGQDRLHSDFLLTILFSDLLSEKFARAAIDERLRIYRQIAESIECGDEKAAGSAGLALVHGYGLAMCRSTIEFLEQHKAGLEVDQPKEAALEAGEVTTARAQE